MLNENWKSVSRQNPCPICKRPDWCQVTKDGRGAVCRRITSAKPTPKGGWFHVVGGGGDGVGRVVEMTTHVAPVPRRNDLHLLAEKFRTSMSNGKLLSLSRSLGLSPDNAHRLDVGWCAGERMNTRTGKCVRINAWSFPMKDASEKVTGIRMRSIEGQKFSFTGGAGGLFIPRDLKPGRAFLVEGPTDTWAALDIGLNVFGRESCMAGVTQIVELIKTKRFDELVIFSQRDERKPRVKGRPDLGWFYPAQDGAERTAQVARAYCPIVRIILPPIGVKDVRIWRQQGAAAADVEQLVAAAPVRKLVIKSSIEEEAGALEGASTK